MKKRLTLRDKKNTQAIQELNLLEDKFCQLYIDMEGTGDKQKGEKHFPFDIGTNVVNESGKIVFRKSLVVEDIFENDIAMNSAFFKNKIPFYENKLSVFCKDKDAMLYQLLSIPKVLNALNDIIKTFNCKVVSAYNVSYDYDGINNLYELKPHITNKFKRLNDLDIQKLFIKYLIDFPKAKNHYFKWCKENGKLTSTGKFASTTAETVYQYITKDLDFKENHTGLEDLKIEIAIYKWIIRKYKSANKPLIYPLNTRGTFGVGLYNGKTPLLQIV